MIRITADLDRITLTTAKARLTAIVYYLNKIHNININYTKIRRSSSKKGCHVILFTDGKLPKYKIIWIRELLGDDWKRIKHDLKRKYPRQYLFKKKVRIRNSKKLNKLKSQPL